MNCYCGATLSNDGPRGWKGFDSVQPLVCLDCGALSWHAEEDTDRDTLRHLLYAAPELLAALEEITERGGRLIPNDGRDFLVVPREGALAQARDAIGRAKGKPCETDSTSPNTSSSEATD